MRKAGVKRSQAESAAKASRQMASRAELLVGGSDAKFRQMVHNLFALLSRHEAIRANHGAMIGLSGVEYTCLVTLGYLQEGGSSVSVKMLADHLYVSGPFVTATVNKLVIEGLIEKKADGEDRRRVFLWITEGGHRVLNAHAPVQRMVNDVRFGSLTREEFEHFCNVLEKLVDSADQAIALQSYLASQTAMTSKTSAR